MKYRHYFNRAQFSVSLFTFLLNGKWNSIITVKKCSRQAWEWKYVMKLWRLSWKEPALHYQLHFIFSSFRKYKVPTSHWQIPGGLVDFHKNKIFNLANNEEKASTSNWIEENQIQTLGILKIAVKATLTWLNIVKIVLKWLCTVVWFSNTFLAWIQIM